MMKVLVVVALVCGTQSYSFDNHHYTRTKLGDAIDKASFKMLKESYDVAGDKNVIASPLGVMMLLSMYKPGAGVLSKVELDKFLDEDDRKQSNLSVTQSYSSLSNQFAELDPNFLTVANKIYVANNYKLNETLRSTARQFRSEVERINFKSPKAAADIINKWADEQTKGHIKTPVSEDVIDQKAAVAMFNVIFFQGHWHVPFNASETEEKYFYGENTIAKKPTMKLLWNLFYAENKELGAKMVELPYKETGFRMVVVLPDKLDGLPTVLEKAARTGLLEDVFNMAPPNREIELEIPKFEIRSTLDLNTILAKVGVSKIFEEPAPGIVHNDTVVVSKAFQEAFVKIDEEGATAGAFTGISFLPLSGVYVPPLPIRFKVDHPFLFLILYEDKVLFTGTYTH